LSPATLGRKGFIMSELQGLLRQKQVLKLIPVSAATWWRGVQTGQFPKPVKLGPKTTAWRAEDIQSLIESLGGEDGKVGPPGPALEAKKAKRGGPARRGKAGGKKTRTEDGKQTQSGGLEPCEFCGE